MAIISKPQIIYKGTSVTFTLFKANLKDNHVVSANSRFIDFSNWKDVYINYKSSVGNQRVSVNFDATTSFQYGTFSVSERARNRFIVESITIVDLDGEVLKIPRNDLNTVTFDIDLYSDSDSDEFVLLLEEGTNFLLESGDFLVLE
jgi:hypothetical protein